MQELEKILEEIKEALEENKVIELNGDGTVNRYIIDVASAWGSIKAIIHNHINDGWIPVDERLPEDDDFVLVTVTGIYNALTFSSAIQLASYCKDDGWFIEGYPDWENPNVSAWRPLPESYQPERSEGE